jgi:hypothetical protein
MHAMEPRQRIYRLTAAGKAAAGNPPRGLSLPCRRILGLLHGHTHFSVIRAGMDMCEESQVATWLGQLEKLGLVQSHAAGAARDLDFTGEFSLADLASRHNAG